ncbi:MAG: 16S rRNA (cytidine(1402)-2'-O)-methyltransferase [Myxococcales bacterium]|nr:16S rRNA (cytidine(1402)-2'-O)-methyltransferase [Myxococcales bacterium]
MSPTAGRLLIVATPIGNLGDISPRAVEALRGADAIACEDTRHTKRLLVAHQIDRPCFSLHDHNEEARANEVVRRIEAGETVALVSDAGTPLISDPGYRVVRACHAAGLVVTHLPGPCAALAAVVLSGLPTDDIRFVGFLPEKGGRRREALAALAGQATTLVFYESPKRLLAALTDVEETLGELPTAVARELTKIHEEVVTGSASQVRDAFAERASIKGECVVVLDLRPTRGDGIPDAALSCMLGALVASGNSRSSAVKRVVEWTGVPKNRVYALALEDEEAEGDER